MQILETGTFTIQTRAVYKGRNMYKSMETLNGVTLELRCIGTQDADEKYPGEQMLEPVNKIGIELFQGHCLTWIASGDVVRVKKNTWEEHQ